VLTFFSKLEISFINRFAAKRFFGVLRCLFGALGGILFGNTNLLSGVFR